MSYTPYNAPLLGGLLGDQEIAAFFSVKAEFEAILKFEMALAAAQGEADVIPKDAAAAIKEALSDIDIDPRAIGEATARDGVVVPELIRQLRDALGAEHADSLHFGSTSQDAIDTSVMMRLRNCIAVLTERLTALLATLSALKDKYGAQPVMAHTRMQRALPISLADKFDNWIGPLDDHLDNCPKRFPLQLGGPNGRLERLGDAAQLVTLNVAEELDLTCPARHWQTDRQPMVDIANWFSMLSGALGKMGHDIMLMAQNEVGEVELSGGGISSAMPHKNNPVRAETLVTLARFNATLISGMHHALVHENERSGSAWTLEWMIMPQMAVATGAALRNAAELLDQANFAPDD